MLFTSFVDNSKSNSYLSPFISSSVNIFIKINVFMLQGHVYRSNFVKFKVFRHTFVIPNV